MPFTLSHIAAAMPMRRSRLVLSALIVGTVAPDLEDFVRLAPGGGWGHSIAGAVCLSLPLGLATLWLFHRFARVPAISLLPESVERRLGSYLTPFRFRGRLVPIIGSMLAGIATHLVWDSFTHRHMWLYHHWAFLHQRTRPPLGPPIQMYFLLQLVSSLVGVLLLILWMLHWYRSTPPRAQPLSCTFSPAQKIFIVVVMLTLSVAGGTVRAVLHFAHIRYRPGDSEWAAWTVVTTTALLWWQLVAWGAILRSRAIKPVPDSEAVAG